MSGRPDSGALSFCPWLSTSDRPQLRFESRTSAARNATCRHPECRIRLRKMARSLAGKLHAMFGAINPIVTVP
jgi:hypothetical protein